METKQCVGCGAIKPVSAFHRSKKSTDGYRGRCKECRKAETTVYYVGHSDAVKARSKAWREANPERFREQLRDWATRPGNLERKRAHNRAYYRAHRQEKKEYYEQPAQRVKSRLNAKNQKAKRKAQIGTTVHPLTK